MLSVIWYSIKFHYLNLIRISGRVKFRFDQQSILLYLLKPGVMNFGHIIYNLHGARSRLGKLPDDGLS